MVGVSAACCGTGEAETTAACGDLSRSVWRAVGLYFHICIFIFPYMHIFIFCWSSSCHLFPFSSSLFKKPLHWLTYSVRASMKKHLPFCLLCTTSCSSVVKGKSHMLSSKKTPQNSRLGGHRERKWWAHIDPGFRLPVAEAVPHQAQVGELNILSPEPKKRSILKVWRKAEEVLREFLDF